MNPQKKDLIKSIVLLTVLFLLSCSAILLSYVFKLVNPGEYGFLKGTKNDLELSFKEILFFASLVFCLFLISTTLRYVHNRPQRVLCICVPFLYLVTAFLFVLADVLYYVIFAYNLTFAIIQTVINTDTEETKDFLNLYSTPGPVAVIVLFVAFLIIVYMRRKWFAQLFRSKPFFIISLLVSIFGIVDFAILSFENPVFSNVRYWDITLGEYKQYREFMEKIASEKDIVNLDKDYNDFYKKDTVNKTIILVVSESLSKGHMSLYGYSRRTTPFLDHNTSIIKYNDCITPATLTSDAVPYLFYNDYNSKDINLIPLLNKLGYETSWISNQAGWGRRDGAIVLLSQLCGTTIFNHALSADDESNWSQHYDEEILDDFEKILNRDSRKSKFIVLHFMGCHFDYEKRYPTNRDYFNTTPDLKKAVNIDKAINIINTYDNAVLYHDSVVNCVLKSVAKYSNGGNKNTALIFLSDHGEELYENRDYIGHAYPPSKIMSEVPYFMYLSENFKRNYPEVEMKMKNRVNTPYSTKNNFYSVIHLLNIGSEKYNDRIQKNSLWSDSYDSTYTRYVMGVDYKNF